MGSPLSPTIHRTNCKWPSPTTAERASCRRACTASFGTEFTGQSTLEQMHRLQGQGLHSHDERRVLVADYIKGKDGWAIEHVRVA